MLRFAYSRVAQIRPDVSYASTGSYFRNFSFPNWNRNDLRPVLSFGRLLGTCANDGSCACYALIRRRGPAAFAPCIAVGCPPRMKWHLVSHAEPGDEAEPVPTCLWIDGHRPALTIMRQKDDIRIPSWLCCRHWARKSPRPGEGKVGALKG